MSRSSLAIVGASARAAAMSAIRAGYEPYAVDLFSDRDLQRIAPCHKIDRADYPNGIGQLLKAAPVGDWMFTGGLENYPDLIDIWQRERPLRGIASSALTPLRDPVSLSSVVPLAECRRAADASMTPLEWICKSRMSSGGNGVHRWDGEPLPDGTYLQRFIRGDSVSAVFIADSAGCRLFGSNIQLVGQAWLHARPFQYCGSIGPRNLVPAEFNQWTQIANRLHQSFELQGVLGIDAVLDWTGVTVIEVNPRYTASVEVLELAYRLAVFSDPLPVIALRPTEDVIGKAVYFAPHQFDFPAVGPWDADLTGSFDPWTLPKFADIPQVGEPIAQGEPVLTFFAQANSESSCLSCLRELAGKLDQLFAK